MAECGNCEHKCLDICEECSGAIHTTKNTIKEMRDLWGITVPFMPQNEWRVIVALHKDALHFDEIAERFKLAVKQDELLACVTRLEYRKLIEAVGGKFSLTQKGAKLLEFGPPDSVAQLAAEQHADFGECVQDAGNYGLVGYEYGNSVPLRLLCIFQDDQSDDDFSRIRMNVLEAYALGFFEIHLWSRDDEQIRRMISGLPKTSNAPWDQPVYDIFLSSRHGTFRCMHSNRIKDSENQVVLPDLASASGTFDSSGVVRRLIRQDRSIICGKPGAFLPWNFPLKTRRELLAGCHALRADSSQVCDRRRLHDTGPRYGSSQTAF